MFLLSALHIKKKKSRPVRICVSCSGLKKPSGWLNEPVWGYCFLFSKIALFALSPRILAFDGSVKALQTVQL